MEKSLASDLARVLMDGKSSLATKVKVVSRYDNLSLAILGGTHSFTLIIVEPKKWQFIVVNLYICTGITTHPDVAVSERRACKTLN